MPEFVGEEPEREESLAGVGSPCRVQKGVFCSSELAVAGFRRTGEALVALGRGEVVAVGLSSGARPVFFFCLFSLPGRVGSAQLGRGEVEMGLIGQGQPMSAVPFSLFSFSFSFPFFLSVLIQI